MGTETATTIEGLDETWPTSGDPVNKGDDHLRTLKDVLKLIFPGTAGDGFAIPITATEAELNFVDGVTSAIQVQLDAKVSNANHTGDATGDTALTIAANAVTLAKMAQIATASFIGRVTAGTGDPEVLTIAQANTMLGLKIIAIGDWDMDATAAKVVAHGLTLADIRQVSISIISDAGELGDIHSNTLGGTVVSGGFIVSTTNVTMNRTTGGGFDLTTHNATSFNRGWITIHHV